MIDSDNLLTNNIPNEILDKVYLLCKIEKIGENYNVLLSKSFPVVWLNENFKNDYGSESDLTVQCVQKENKNFALLSAGCFLWHKDKMILLKRDNKAPSYAGAIVEAAGRCGELPSLTIIKELNEEILITTLDPKGSIVLALIDDISHRDDIIRIKQKQIKDKAIELKIKDVELEEFYPKELAKNKVNIYKDGTFIESINGYSYYDEIDNTLEIRQSYKLNDGIELDLIFDGEPFNRQIFIKNFQELQNEYTSNTIKNVCTELANNNTIRRKT